METNKNIVFENEESAPITEDITLEKHVSFEEYDCDSRDTEYLIEDGSKDTNILDNVENSILLDSSDNNLNQGFDFNRLIDSLSDIQNLNAETFGNKSECAISNQKGLTDLNLIMENILHRKLIEEEQICDTIVNNKTDSSPHSILGSVNEAEISDSLTEDNDLNPINVDNLINIYDGPQYEKNYINENSNVELVNGNINIEESNNFCETDNIENVHADQNSIKLKSFATIRLNPQFQNNNIDNSSMQLLNENINTEIINKVIIEENNFSKNDKIKDHIYEKDDGEVLEIQSQSQNELTSSENDVIYIAENNLSATDKSEDLVQEKDNLKGLEPQSFTMLRVKSPTKLNQQLNTYIINSQETRLKNTEPSSQEQNIELKIVLLLGNEIEQICNECYLPLICKFLVKYDKNDLYICRDSCLISFCARKNINSSNSKDAVTIETNLQVKPVIKDVQINLTTSGNTISADTTNKKKFIRKCAECFSKINNELNSNTIIWQVMEFCNTNCLGDYQTKMLTYCGFCKYKIIGNNIGRYCVRFGNKINQFCNSTCLEKYKNYLKICSYCQKDICYSTKGFSAPIGNKFKDFCSSKCMELFDFLVNRNTKRKIEIGHCSVCNDERQFLITYEKLGNIQKFCCDPCFVAFKFVNKIDPLQCITCKKYYKKKNTTEFSIYYDSNIKHFCSETCQNVYIITNRRIIACNWCKVNKYNFDLIYKECSSGQILHMCSLHCLRLFQESNNTIRAEKQTCSSCLQLIQAEFHLTMSDSTIRSFCNAKCVNYYLQKYTNLKVTDNAQNNLNQSGQSKSTTTYTEKGLKIPPLKLKTAPNSTTLLNRPTSEKTNATTTQIIYYPYQNSNQNSSRNTRQVIIKPRPHPIMKNKSTSCKPITRNKRSLIKPCFLNKRLQTDENTQIDGIKSLLPIPVPIYVPTPVPLYRQPIPITIPFPIPIAVPIFIPTIRNSVKGIAKELKRIRDNFPSDPLEAEMVQMAKLAVGKDNNINYTDSESDENLNTDISDLVENDPKYQFDEEDDLPLKNIVNEALNIDLETSLIANKISIPTLDIKSPKNQTRSKYRRIIDISQCETIKLGSNNEIVGVKGNSKPNDNKENVKNAKFNASLENPRSEISRRRSKRAAFKNTEEIIEEKRQKIINIKTPLIKLSTNIEIRKTGDDLSLKFMFGVNAWKQWINKKNIILKNSLQKLFVDEILELTLNELNCSLCLFVQEVCKPDGTQYAPDTIYYLCLGIQLYLLENGRSDNIFSDFSYKNFIDSFDVISKKFSTLYDDSNYIVTRVEEEYLWESIQLGVFSPYTLLTTLIYFNTLYFNLMTVEDHMNISFLHIVKCHKGNSKIVSLRCYPPLYSHKKPKKLKYYEIFENKKNVYRCPIKLYDFYINKCPDSVKKRDDIFYLLPERSCVADSPVWFSNDSLDRRELEKILLRIKMVREINEALLASRVIG